MGVNKYGYQQWCDFFWNDTSPEGRFFVIIFLLQGNYSLLAAWRSENAFYHAFYDTEYKSFTVKNLELIHVLINDDNCLTLNQSLWYKTIYNIYTINR